MCGGGWGGGGGGGGEQGTLKLVEIRKVRLCEFRQYFKPQMRQPSKTLRSAFEDIPLVEVMYVVFTRMPTESYSRSLTSLLLCLYDVFRALINSLMCCFCVHS